MTGQRDKLINFVSKFIDTFKFSNDHFAVIMGYGDLQIGNILISQVYYVEGLGHNLFSIGQFCDSGLEVAFRKQTCFVRNFIGVDLLSGSHGFILYTISMEDMIKSSPICLLSKASKTKSWLWHRRLSHLNFETINQHAKQGLVKGLTKLKYAKDHLYSACQIGKSKKESYKPKAKPSMNDKLQMLHMDLCGLMRVENIIGKKYILVIVDDYSRFTWVKFFRTKDEIPEVIIIILKQAPVAVVWMILLSDIKISFNLSVVDAGVGFDLMTRVLSKSGTCCCSLASDYDCDCKVGGSIDTGGSMDIRCCNGQNIKDIMGKNGLMVMEQAHLGCLLGRFMEVSHEGYLEDVAEINCMDYKFCQNPRGIFINQSKYALEMLKKYGLEQCDVVDTPMAKVNELRAERLARAHDPLALMANSNNPYNYPVFHQDQPSQITYMQQPQPINTFIPQPSFNTNYMQQPMPYPEYITNPTTAMNMALVLMAKAFKLNY
ncbi:retrovirus-related pol polyprotein from transposon TNT 1-94 [Tanacetum coccineum]